MYRTAPKIVSRVGHKEAQKIYREMAKVVFQKNTKEVVFNIVRDFLCFTCMPIASVLYELGVVHNLNNWWNIYCVSSKTRKITNFYNWYYIISYCSIVLFSTIFICVRLFITKKKFILKEKLHNLLLPIMATIIIGAWFSVGDGAPPNDRYELIGYQTWALLSLKVFNTNVSL